MIIIGCEYCRIGNYSVGLRGVCPSEARALAALTVRKPGHASKNPIAEGNFGIKSNYGNNKALS